MCVSVILMILVFCVLKGVMGDSYGVWFSFIVLCMCNVLVVLVCCLIKVR